MAFYAKCCQASSTYKALHNPWSHFFGLWWVSLAEYLLILRVLFPLLQMVQFIMAIARIASVPPWTRSKPWTDISYQSLSFAFVEVWLWAGTIFKQCCRCWFQTFNLLPLLSYLNVVYNNFNSYSDGWTVFVNFM